jgi:hypothetical protein
MHEPKSIVNIAARNIPMNGDAIRPVNPVNGCWFQCTVLAPKNAKQPMINVKGTNVKNRPIPASLNNDPAEIRAT